MRLLKRVFALDMMRCSFCQQGSLQIIAAITHGTVIRKILRHLQLAADPPSIAPPRVRQAACACSSTGRVGVSQTPPGALARGDHTALPGNVCLPVTWRRGRVVSSGLHNPDGACPTGLWHNSVCNSSTPTGLASLSFIIHSSSFLLSLWEDAMDSILTPQKADQGWVMEIPRDMTRALGVPDGSLAVLYVQEGQIEIEVLPPPSPELKESVRRIYEKHKDAFEEMKRRGD